MEPYYKETDGAFLPRKSSRYESLAATKALPSLQTCHQKILVTKKRPSLKEALTSHSQETSLTSETLPTTE
ncbi:Hypothetical protein NTJ_01938 [Nesidiocoris tenuis]|uniref:Uncharacterized protein n=1 Tax=Nesidiocoris tenuis TaxID=355587 RepID=A0ABN7AE49_9HEMI|nr:Hypothetical protein NTJ_01938 [Nesidiocoris tenuis]